MSIITLSRGPYSKGNEVAERVAARLGYRCLSGEVLAEASKKYQVPQNKLVQAVHDAPSLWGRVTSLQQRYIACVAAEILAQFQTDKVVYHGLAGHFFAAGIPHALKVRIVADMKDRIYLAKQRGNLSGDQAKHLLKADDRMRKAWANRYYQVDSSDPGLYDLAIHIGRLSVDDAVDLICQTVDKPQFQTTPMSQQAVENLALAAGIRADLLVEHPYCEVVADRGSVEICIRFTLHSDTMITDKIREEVLQQHPGVSSVKINLIPSVIFT